MMKKTFAFLVAVVLLLGCLPVSTALGAIANSSRVRKPALVFEQIKGYAKWQKSGNKIKITFNLENLDPDADIDAFDIVIYCKNVYEEIIYPDDCGIDAYQTTYTLEKTVRSGKTAYSGYCVIEGLSGVKYIYAAIAKYHYTPGSTPSFQYREANSNNTVTIPTYLLDWHQWTYK